MPLLTYLSAYKPLSVFPITLFYHMFLSERMCVKHLEGLHAFSSNVNESKNQFQIIGLRVFVCLFIRSARGYFNGPVKWPENLA